MYIEFTKFASAYYSLYSSEPIASYIVTVRTVWLRIYCTQIYKQLVTVIAIQLLDNDFTTVVLVLDSYFTMHSSVLCCTIDNGIATVLRIGIHKFVTRLLWYQCVLPIKLTTYLISISMTGNSWTLQCQKIYRVMGNIRNLTIVYMVATYVQAFH